MDPSPTSPSPSHSWETSKPSALICNFQWRRFKTLVTDVNNPDANPLYIIHYKTLQPQIVFKRAADDKTIGTGTLHTFNIDADYSLHGRKDTLVAQKRFHTVYTHRSLAMSDTDKPVTLTWTSDSNFKTWDFVCVDEQQMPIAKFTANIWAMKKLGKIEFMGPKADREALRDEILVTGLTLVYCMTLRSSSIFSLFGAFFASPGHDKKYNSDPAPADRDGDDGKLARTNA